MAADPWSPAQYDRFRTERQQPFADLVGLITPRAEMRVVDLGCGTGELTARLHHELGARETLGFDSSTEMLARQPTAIAGLRFAAGDIAAFADTAAWDLVFSNAAVQWVPDHPALLRRLRDALRPGGQLAIQMPANFGHPSHTAAREVGAEPPFREALGGWHRHVPVREPEDYAVVLARLGARAQHVRLQVYGHELASRDEVVEWTKGTLLTDYQRRLDPATYEAFLIRYRARLLPQLSDARPYFYPFRRILLWAAF
ncbi:MAG TPA: methyltransferase domain-containing protein [Candidatus Binatia bacterium]|jgi:trans-aconitate 2-methyltransferase|nr:methyltransferase domain-containing protein [Candidatus Binatia bacterium]